jgi:hypothetical protein
VAEILGNSAAWDAFLCTFYFASTSRRIWSHSEKKKKTLHTAYMHDLQLSLEELEVPEQHYLLTYGCGIHDIL